MRTEHKGTPIRIAHHGRELLGTVYLPEEERFPVVIFSHGFNGGGDDFNELAEGLSREGVGAVTFSFCGGGVRDRSGFGTTNMTLLTEREDLLAVIDHAKAIEGFNGRLLLFGGSQGGMVSALAAQETEDVCGMILLYPAFGIPDDWNALFPRSLFPDGESLPKTVTNFHGWGMDLGREFILSARETDVFSGMPSFAGPVLILHGRKDGVVDIAYSRRATGEGGYPRSLLLEYDDFPHGALPPFSDVREKLLPLIKTGELPSRNR